jgi:predicted membrane channel-forming protein YqfA (hemolysin III family)
MLGKLAGGFTAVAGFTGAVIVVTRRANPSWPDILLYLLLGISGLFIFYISSMLAKKRTAENDGPALTPLDAKKAGRISWIFFLAAAMVFILFTYIITK